ncbi:hypothetical protein SOVF_185460 [Spinacia oleracea]|nr:hypothetical protein SOVF_185460 [Spinacia oleracea]
MLIGVPKNNTMLAIKCDNPAETSRPIRRLVLETASYEPIDVLKSCGNNNI